MKRIVTRSLTTAVAFALAAGLVASVAFATPSPNGATIQPYVFNDCAAPFSTLVVNNSYPGTISFDDTYICTSANFANLHTWTFSEDGGATDAVFNNGDSFTFGADFMLSGPGNGEGGLRFSPWFSKYVDGRFNCRVPDGEIACFGGRLPFYSFTGAFGLHYVKGTVIHLEIAYSPRGLSAGSPATIEYHVVYGGTSYSSGPLAFDMANPAEDPPYGLWGMLNDGRAGGYFVAFVGQGPNEARGTWTNIDYATSPTATTNSTWGRLKSLYR